MVTFCENCGEPLVEAAKFCVSCGQSLTRPPPTELSEPIVREPDPLIAPQPLTPEPTPAYDKKKPLYKRWWFWLIAILVIGGAVNVLVNVVAPLNHSPKNLLVGAWVSTNSDSSFVFQESGTCYCKIESYGSSFGTYEIDDEKSLVLSLSGGESPHLWKQTTEPGNYWYVSKDQLIIDGIICIRASKQ